jgi:hypothetical protein
VITTKHQTLPAPIGGFPASDSIPADLRSIALQSLEADPIFRGRMNLRAIHIEVEGDRLVLNGRLPSYYLKQRLQEVIRRVAGVRDVENLVEVTNN